MNYVLNFEFVEESGKLFDVLPYVTSVVCAIIAGLVSWLVAHKQSKSAIKELEEQYKLDLQQYQERDLYEMRKTVIFKALSLFDDYVSWLTIDGKKPIRKQSCTNAKLTFQARQVYNELCVTVDNVELIKLFKQIFFCDSKFFLGKLSEFRMEARKELGLSEIEISSDASFISKIGTNDLTKHKKTNCKKVSAKKAN